MAWPKLLADLNKISENCEKVTRFCSEHNISVTGVTKGICADPRLVGALEDCGCSMLGDSRIQNLAEIRSNGTSLPLVLLRIPMLSELVDVVKYSDMALISSAETLLHLERVCNYLNMSYDIIVMVDLGDLREGLLIEDIVPFAEQLRSCSRIRTRGIAVNFGCFGGVMPDTQKMEDLIHAGKMIEKIVDHPLEIYSGGSTSSLYLMEKQLMPTGITNLRIGEAILLGTDVNRNRVFPYLNEDTMFLEAEVIEFSVKGSVPFGTIGADAFGKVPVFEDRGQRKRAIAAVGKQDLRIDGIRPVDKGIVVLGASSDHLILDVEDLKRPLRIGSLLRFSAVYPSMLSLATSPYVSFDML